MSGSYSPDEGLEVRNEGATAVLVRHCAFLLTFQPTPFIYVYTDFVQAQRDLGLEIPINFVTEPGVSLSTVCGYAGDLGKCVSNLLAVGFRRLEVDFYWHEAGGTWSFCPWFGDVENTVSRRELDVRQVGTASSVENATLTSSSTLPTTTSLPGNQNIEVSPVGTYNCTTDFILTKFTSLLSDYFSKTDTTLAAHLLYVYINIHASTNISTPLSPPPTPSQLPSDSKLLSEIFKSNLSDVLYTPQDLASERANINGSWYTVAERYRPSQDYYNISLDEYKIASTIDGWPSTSFVEFARGKRILLGWGNVGMQMVGYNFTSDEDTIFPRGFLRSERNITIGTNGEVVEGCLFQNGTSKLGFGGNTSWAEASTILDFAFPTLVGEDLRPLLNLTQNSMNCGFSPFLNTSLLRDGNGAQSFLPYQNFTQATIWSWAEGEPRSYNTTSATNKTNPYHCATMSSTSGHWANSDCGSTHYVACRATGQPWNWTLSNTAISYAYAEGACGRGYGFATPRTGLENRYLLEVVREKVEGGSVWVDFNELDEVGCWVTGGKDAECLWKISDVEAEFMRKRIILVGFSSLLFLLFIPSGGLPRMASEFSRGVKTCWMIGDK